LRGVAWTPRGLEADICHRLRLFRPAAPRPVRPE